MTSIHLFLRIDSKYVHSSYETVIGSEVIYDLSTHSIAAELELSTTVTGNLFTVDISKNTAYITYDATCSKEVIHELLFPLLYMREELSLYREHMLNIEYL